MPTPSHLTREVLYHRHRLSHQQIDDFLGEKESRNFITEKLEDIAMLKEFLLVTDQFREAGISFIALKGPLLSYRLYNDATYRRYKDFDFLMDLASIGKAVGLLLRMGYVTDIFNWSDDPLKQQLIIKHDKHILLSHPENNSSIEIHWMLITERFVDLKIINQIVETNQTDFEFAGRNFKTFNPEFELIYLIIHGGIHAWQRLKWLVDIHQLVKNKTVDKERFAQLTSKLKADRMVILCNSMLNEYFPDDSKLPVQGKGIAFLRNFSIIQINMADVVIYDTFSKRLKSIWFKLIAFPGWRYKFDVLKGVLLYSQDLNDNQIPSYSTIYYIYGPIKKLLIRIGFLFQPSKRR